MKHVAWRCGLILAVTSGCGETPAGGGDEATSAAGTTEASASSSSESEAGSESTGEPPDDAAVYDEFYGRILGLWIAPVSSWTSVGDLPLMTMDVRPADGRVLFSRVDLDGGNALRLAFSRETHEGQDTLVFRNGGLFLGIERDSRTRLVEYDQEQERFRFCAIVGGCDYIDATFDFDGRERFALDVDVRSMMHIHWAPTLAETRPLDMPFPADDGANPADAPFPEMPTLRATMTWSEPLAEPGRVWIILSTSPCTVPTACTPSRFIGGEAPAGATEAELTIVQIHPGDYRVNAVLDRNANLGAALLPDTGDAVALPDTPLTIATTGETETTIAIPIEL